MNPKPTMLEGLTVEPEELVQQTVNMPLGGRWVSVEHRFGRTRSRMRSQGQAKGKS